MADNETPILCASLGFLLIVLGSFGYFVTANSLQYWAYKDLTLFAIGLGCLLIIVGVVLNYIKKPEGERRVVYVPLKKCPKCGKQFSGEEYEFCPTCGVKLEST